jgi:hypothetical protein
MSKHVKKGKKIKTKKVFFDKFDDSEEAKM